MSSSSESGWYLRLIDLVSHSTLGSRVIQKRERGLDGSLDRKRVIQEEGLASWGLDIQVASPRQAHDLA